MSNELLKTYLKLQTTVEKEGICITKDISDKTVWDELAIENPTHAVISAKDEAEAKLKSEVQISDIKKHLKSTDVLLDCGTGYGRVAKYLLPQMTLAGYIGVDSSFQMLKLFKQRYQLSETENRTPLLLVNADIHTLPIKDNSIDVILVSAVFLHNHKSIVEKSMKEIKRIIKPGGKLLVYSSFPRSGSLMGLQGHLYQMLLNLLGKPFKNGPVRYYSRKEVLKLLDGFTTIEIKPVGFAVVPKTIIGLPRPLEVAWRVGFANPLNRLFEKITPDKLKPYFAVHYDVTANK